MAELAHYAVAVCGHRLNEHAYAARPVALEGHFFVLLALELAGAAQNGALDVVVRHVFVLRRENRRSQTRIRVRIASADARRNGDFSDDSRKHAPALRVG